MPIGPVPNQNQHHHNHHAPPPQYLSRPQIKLLLLLFDSINTFAVKLILVFFFGFTATIVFLSNPGRHNISGRGLANRHAAIIIPGIRYSVSDYPGMLDCVICLDAFREGDECRNLRVCKHLFHSKCVDRWIEKNPSCPVCRTSVVSTGDDRWEGLGHSNF